MFLILIPLLFILFVVLLVASLIPELIKLAVAIIKNKILENKKKKYDENKMKYISQDAAKVKKILNQSADYLLLDPKDSSSDICECCKKITHSKNIHGVFICNNCEELYNNDKKIKLTKYDIQDYPLIFQILELNTNTYHQNKLNNTDFYCYTCGLNISNDKVTSFKELGTHRYCLVCAHNEYKFKHLIPTNQEIFEAYQSTRKAYPKRFEKQNRLTDYQVNSLIFDSHSTKMMSKNQYICTDRALIIPQTVNILPYFNIIEINYVRIDKWEIKLTSGETELIKDVTREEMFWFLYNYSDKFDVNFQVSLGGRLPHIQYSLLKEYSKKYNK